MSSCGDPKPSVPSLLSRGWRRKCPCCGRTPLFVGYLKVIDRCHQCDQNLGDLRADDFPPYLTMFIVGHIVVPLVLIVERFYAPPIFLHLSIWLPLSVLLSYYFLPRTKGVVVGWMTHLGIRGDETY